MATKATFSVSVVDDYIRLDTWGVLEVDQVSDPVDAALALAEVSGIYKLLDNIQKVDFTTASLHVQAKGMGVLWKLRKFKRVAIIFSGEEPGYLFYSSLRELRLDVGSKFQGFENEIDALRWLREQ